MEGEPLNKSNIIKASLIRYKLIGVNTYGSIFTKITDSMNTWIKKNTDGAEDINLNFFHNCDCGRKNKAFDEGISIVPVNRIIDPEDADSHEFPWLALVVLDARDRPVLPSVDDNTICGGSLITAKVGFLTQSF